MKVFTRTIYTVLTGGKEQLAEDSVNELWMLAMDKNPGEDDMKGVPNIFGSSGQMCKRQKKLAAKKHVFSMLKSVDK